MLSIDKSPLQNHDGPSGTTLARSVTQKCSGVTLMQPPHPGRSGVEKGSALAVSPCCSACHGMAKQYAGMRIQAVAVKSRAFNQEKSSAESRRAVPDAAASHGGIVAAIEQSSPRGDCDCVALSTANRMPTACSSLVKMVDIIASFKHYFLP